MPKPQRQHNRGAVGRSRRSVGRNPMEDYDRLPAELRDWVQNAKLPWSARSCRKIWSKVMAERGSTLDAIKRLDQVEMATLRKMDA